MKQMADQKIIIVFNKADVSQYIMTACALPWLIEQPICFNNKNIKFKMLVITTYNVNKYINLYENKFNKVGNSTIKLPCR